MSKNDEKNWSVNLWGTHPDAENDDCWTGEDFADEETARRTFDDLQLTFSVKQIAEAAYVELDGPNINDVRRNPAYVPALANNDDDWKREQAMQAGMVFGADGYNDVMGY